IVVGGGAAGSAAAYHLAKAGVDVLLLEQAQPDCGDGQQLLHGSSAGESRITRLTDVDEHMTRMSCLAMAAWKELEEDWGAALVKKTGGLEVGLREAPQLASIRAAAQAAGVPLEELTSAEIKQRWPAFSDMPSDIIGLFNKDAGILNPVKCIEAFRSLATRKGARLRFGERLVGLRWVAETKHFELLTQPVSPTLHADPSRAQTTHYRCGRVVLAPGSWLKESLRLLTPPVPIPTSTVWEISYGWYRVATEKTAETLQEMSAIPVWRSFHQSRCYGFPVSERPGWVKVAPHAAPKESIFSDPQERSRKPNLVEFDATRQLVGTLFGSRLSPEPVGHEQTCLYTVTADERFVLGAHPAIPDGRLVLCGGFCGSGFKHSALVGRLATEMVLNNGMCKQLDLSPFCPGRPGLYAAPASELMRSAKL
ncbi:unnamed protein product, partial [Polarella glacialis]